ncbi:OTU domain-containing protein 6B [Pyricularia oryzae Y34]|nr:OTU domain-containing protein 6B [Pyricularia oryzae Y34]
MCWIQGAMVFETCGHQLVDILESDVKYCPWASAKRMACPESMCENEESSVRKVPNLCENCIAQKSKKDNKLSSKLSSKLGLRRPSTSTLCRVGVLLLTIEQWRRQNLNRSRERKKSHKYRNPGIILIPVHATMESLEQMQARHRKELKDLQGRITSKKKNATKKTRKGVNDECAELERQMKERHESETRQLGGTAEEEEAEKSEDEPAVDDTRQNGESQAPSNEKESVEVGGTQPPQNQAGKKRNRQKERLARRAAEQEAAAEAAAAEASNMVDHRSNEAAHMARELATHSLVEKEIAPDGHCLFSAFADQLSTLSIPLQQKSGAGDDSVPAYRIVRRAASSYISDHADDFAPFLEEPLDDYVRKMRDTAEWGGHMELLALASTYNVEVRVIADGRTAVVQPKEPKEDEPARQSRPPLLSRVAVINEQRQQCDRARLRRQYQNCGCEMARLVPIFANHPVRQPWALPAPGSCHQIRIQPFHQAERAGQCSVQARHPMEDLPRTTASRLAIEGKPVGPRERGGLPSFVPMRVWPRWEGRIETGEELVSQGVPLWS